MNWVQRNIFLNAILGGILLSLSWYFGLMALIFVAFVPLLIIENYFASNFDAPRRKLRFYLTTYITFLIWNLGVTWWVYCVQFGKEGAILAFLANSALMTMVFVTFSNIRRKLNKSWGIWLLIPIWVAWEFAHTLWDLTWPWLTLGNVFSYKTNWVQWYEYTGVSGGSIWILASNILLYQTLQKPDFAIRNFIRPLTVILTPILLSYIILFTYSNDSKLPEKEIVIVQPNMDPYNEKFDEDFSLQFSSALEQIKGKISTQTDFLVFPETFIVPNLDEQFILHSPLLGMFYDSLIMKYPKLNIVTGANTYRFYDDEKKKTTTARFDKNSGKYYDIYNTALFMNKDSILIYHKSKLVPGVELMPFPWLMKPFESLAIDLGGTVGSLGTQSNRAVFTSPDGVKVAPVICYESVYGDYCAEYIRNGANYIFIITNDGWWDNTPGHKQHLNYGRLRAIETRRNIIRSANTGISAIIDEVGNIHDATSWWQKAVIKEQVKGNDQLTFFVRFGDILARISIIVALTALFYHWFLRFFKR